MFSRLKRWLLIIATLFGAVLAGGNIDRELVTMPAWQHLGPQAWAAFSRHADLGPGLLYYPVIGIGSTLLAIAAAAVFLFERRTPRTAQLSLAVAAVLMIVGLILTIKAAPIMLDIAAAHDTATLQNAFNGFYFWGNLRAIAQVCGFLAELWAVSSLLCSADSTVTEK
jgi:hypothetical protein